MCSLGADQVTDSQTDEPNHWIVSEGFGRLPQIARTSPSPENKRFHIPHIAAFLQTVIRGSPLSRLISLLLLHRNIF